MIQFDNRDKKYQTLQAFAPHQGKLYTITLSSPESASSSDAQTSLEGLLSTWVGA